jgi:hypothetical protein
MVLPSAWKDRLGHLEVIDTIQFETARQDTVQGEICGPVRIQIEGFRPIYSEVVFVEMRSSDGVYDGYPNVPLPVVDPAAALSWLTSE